MKVKSQEFSELDIGGHETCSVLGQSDRQTHLNICPSLAASSQLKKSKPRAKSSSPQKIPKFLLHGLVPVDFYESGSTLNTENYLNRLASLQCQCGDETHTGHNNSDKIFNLP